MINIVDVSIWKLFINALNAAYDVTWWALKDTLYHDLFLLLSFEQHLPQIVKESVAVQFGRKKFHSFVYGNNLWLRRITNRLKQYSRKNPELQKKFLEISPYPKNCIK